MIYGFGRLAQSRADDDAFHRGLMREANRLLQASQYTHAQRGPQFDRRGLPIYRVKAASHPIPA